MAAPYSCVWLRASPVRRLRAQQRSSRGILYPSPLRVAPHASCPGAVFLGRWVNIGSHLARSNRELPSAILSSLPTQNSRSSGAGMGWSTADIRPLDRARMEWVYSINEIGKVGAEAGIISAGIAQVVDDVGNPRSHSERRQDRPSLAEAPLHFNSTPFVAIPNTTLTPAPRSVHPPGHTEEGLLWEMRDYNKGRARQHLLSASDDAFMPVCSTNPWTLLAYSTPNIYRARWANI